MIHPVLLSLFNLFCLVFGVFMVLYYIVLMIQRGRGNIFFALLALAALTWGLYSVVGVQP